MASPLFDGLHLKLSRKIADDVASAATDGQDVSSALRTDYLNRANRFIQTFLWVNGRDKVEVYLQGLLKAQSLTFSSSGVSVASDYSYWIALKKTTPVQLFTWWEPSRAALLDMNANVNLGNLFTIYGNKLYAYQAGAIVGSGTGTLLYIQSDQRAGAGDTADIAIDSLWHDALIDIAASYFFEEKGKMDFSQANVQRTSTILGIIGKQ